MTGAASQEPSAWTGRALLPPYTKVLQHCPSRVSTELQVQSHSPLAPFPSSLCAMGIRSSSLPMGRRGLGETSLGSYATVVSGEI